MQRARTVRATDKSSNEKGKRLYIEVRGGIGRYSRPDEQIRMQRANYEYRADKIGNERAYKASDKGEGGRGGEKGEGEGKRVRGRGGTL